MKGVRVNTTRALQGSATIPGDKSLSHRALLLGALAEGTSTVENFLPSGDCLATGSALRSLGIDVQIRDHRAVVIGRGLYGFHPPQEPVHCVRSGTTMRLLAGILAAQPFSSVLSGEEQLLRRPMERVAAPLRQMGARIQTTEGHAPLYIEGTNLHGTEIRMQVASAQVKSAILLAGLYADAPTSIVETAPTRDHTERMLQAMGADLEIKQMGGERIIRLRPLSSNTLKPNHLTVPGDFSSAAFPMTAALLTPDSHITLQNVGVNPTRTGLLDVFTAMGAHIKQEHQGTVANEPTADLHVQTSQLEGTVIAGDTVVRMIDEFPILAVAATQAKGKTLVQDAGELRVKETDRIRTTVTELKRLGAKIEELPDGFVIEGPTPLTGAEVSSHGDHRLAMALFVAGLIARGETVIDDIACAADSFPGFLSIMQTLGARYELVA